MPSTDTLVLHTLWNLSATSNLLGRGTVQTPTDSSDKTHASRRLGLHQGHQFLLQQLPRDMRHRSLPAILTAVFGFEDRHPQTLATAVAPSALSSSSFCSSPYIYMYIYI